MDTFHLTRPAGVLDGSRIAFREISSRFEGGTYEAGPLTCVSSMHCNSNLIDYTVRYKTTGHYVKISCVTEHVPAIRSRRFPRACFINRFGLKSVTYV